ncbi:MAG: hypothetical protein DHS20C18_47490 [Saprospiraceae bacterium]|nr:MAG: hypothetical protein DHS20C18_47490 [Saprospiraceae bacterium]
MSFTKFVILFAVSGLFACSNPQSKITGEPSTDKSSPQTLTDIKGKKKEEKAVISAHNKSATQVGQAKDQAISDTEGTNTSYNKKEALSNQVSQKKTKTKTKAETSSTKLLVPQATPKTEVSKAAEKNKVINKTPPPAQNQDGISHMAWNKMLQQNVSASGKVNYKAFKSNIAGLNAYLDLLAKNPVQSTWSRSEQMAYWINAYNAFTVKLIIDNYPLNSITDLYGGKPWDVSWIKLGDKTYSLNQIENDILRPKYKDARIHFAVNCAAKSCPPLLNKAWTADNLNATLDSQAKKFINNSNYNQISTSEVSISKIFDWYSSDFGNIVDYLNQFSTTKINTDAKVNYKEYDWALNN